MKQVFVVSPNDQSQYSKTALPLSDLPSDSEVHAWPSFARGHMRPHCGRNLATDGIEATNHFITDNDAGRKPLAGEVGGHMVKQGCAWANSLAKS